MSSDDTPSLDQLLGADEAPMRRELRRQIGALERTLSEFRRDHAPFDPLPPGSEGPPVLLATDELERVRDDLLARIAALHDRVADRFVAGLEVPPPRAAWGLRWAALRRRLHR